MNYLPRSRRKSERKNGILLPESLVSGCRFIFLRSRVSILPFFCHVEKRLSYEIKCPGWLRSMISTLLPKRHFLHSAAATPPDAFKADQFSSACRMHEGFRPGVCVTLSSSSLVPFRLRRVTDSETVSAVMHQFSFIHTSLGYF